MKTDLNWHARFKQQATWTKSLRRYLYKQADLWHAKRILEVGCGTGGILSELPEFTSAEIIGVDINRPSLLESVVNAPECAYTQADALFLPFRGQIFDITYCHFLLLWLINPLQAIIEMRRVTRQGGAILLMAEPDYSNRIDFPEELKILGYKQTKSLLKQGADPFIGKRMVNLLEQAGIIPVETGILEREETGKWDPKDWELEWEVLESDLRTSMPPHELASLKKIDMDSRFSGKRILHVPTYFAWGRV